VQALVIPISDERHSAYGREVAGCLLAAGLRAELDAGKDRMQAKIRRAQLQKVPYMLVLGDKEQAAGSVSVRLRSGEDLGALPLDNFIERVKNEVSSRAA
jgi:threonyl-tRNA synthetase